MEDIGLNDCHEVLKAIYLAELTDKYRNLKIICNQNIKLLMFLEISAFY